MDQDNNFLDENFGPKRVPTFLKVLCIITFVVSGILIIISAFDLATYDPEMAQARFEESIYELEKMPDNPFKEMMMDMTKTTVEDQLEHHTTLSILSVFSVLLSLLGAILMYKLKKIGFHIYVVSKLVGFSQILFITLVPMITIGYVFVGIFTVAFVIMYAVNLKHMS